MKKESAVVAIIAVVLTAAPVFGAAQPDSRTSDLSAIRHNHRQQPTLQEQIAGLKAAAARKDQSAEGKRKGKRSLAEAENLLRVLQKPGR